MAREREGAVATVRTLEVTPYVLNFLMFFFFFIF